MGRLRLGTEIGVLLAAKLVLLFGLYFLFFAHPAPSEAAATASHVIGAR